jgi:penicillin-binding protein A
MGGWSRWIGLAIALTVIGTLVPGLNTGVSQGEPLRRGERRAAPDRFAGLDLSKARVEKDRVVVPMRSGEVAELTVDARLQRAALGPMKRHRVPEAGVVMMNVKTGEVLVYASAVHGKDPFDVNARAEAPAASVFKIVTGAALIEKAGLTPKTKQCYRGGRSRIREAELRPSKRYDNLCASLDQAMGRSINVIFARLAQKHLTPGDLRAMGGALGFGAPVPFVVPNEAPLIDIPSEPVEFARTAAGFWHTSLSPLAGASMVQAVANGGLALKPRIVRKTFRGKRLTWRSDGEPRVLRRAMKQKTARALTQMMEKTVSSGTGRKSFRDKRGRAYIPGVRIAGKTGSLTRHKQKRLYTWFVGFAPAEDPEVAVAALVVNTPLWHIKAPHLAREVLQAYFER